MRIVPVTISEAKKFVAIWHRHLDPPLSAIFAIGLEHDGQLVGVALCGRPIARHLDDGWTVEVTRTCTQPTCPKGGISKLLNSCRKVAGGLGYRKCITYTLASESGSSAKGAGWIQAKIIKPRGGWSCPSRKRRKGYLENVRKIRWEIDSQEG